MRPFWASEALRSSRSISPIIEFALAESVHAAHALNAMRVQRLSQSELIDPPVKQPG